MYYRKIYIGSEGCNMAGDYYIANGSDSSYGTSCSDDDGNVCSDIASSSCYNCGYNFYYDTSYVYDTPPGDSLYMEYYSSGYG